MTKNEIRLSLGLWDFNDITHNEITRLMGIAPSKIYVKGLRKNPNFLGLAKKNGWLLDAPFCDVYTPFERQMDALLGIIEERKEILKPLCEKYYCEFSCGLYVYLDSEESTPSVHLNARYNRLLKELKIEFDLDVILLETSKG